MSGAAKTRERFALFLSHTGANLLLFLPGGVPAPPQEQNADEGLPVGNTATRWKFSREDSRVCYPLDFIDLGGKAPSILQFE